MTREEAKIYFEQCNSKIISVCKDENKYDYKKQEIISDCARKTYEANRLAIELLEQEPILDRIREEIKVMTSNRGFLSCSVGYIHEKIDNVFDKYKAEIEPQECEEV